jgi:hypothetical protein
VVLFVVGMVGAAYGANKLLQSQANQLLTVRSKAAALQNQQVALASAKKEIARYQSLSNIAESVVPQDKDQALTVNEIVTLAARSDVTLGAITFPPSTLGGVVAPTVSGVAEATPIQSAQSIALSQLTPVTDIPGVYSLTITVASDPTKTVPYAQFVNFLSSLEQNRRTALVTGIAIQPDPTNHGNISFTLTLNEYIKL